MDGSLFHPWKTIFNLTVLALFTFPSGYSQGTAPQDSLEQAYLKGAFPAGDSLEVLYGLTREYEDPQKILNYSERLIEVASRQDSVQRLYDGYLQKGNALRLLGSYGDALESYFKAANLAIGMGSDDKLGDAYITIADAYSLMGNQQNARSYYRKAIEILRGGEDSLHLGMALSNAGDEYFKQGKLDSALLYFEESGKIFRDLSFTNGIGYHLGSLGMVYSAQGRTAEALEKLDAAIAVLEGDADHYGVAAFLPYLSDIYKRKGDLRRALETAEKSLEIGKQYGYKEQISDANRLLSELHEQLGNPTRSLAYYKAYTAYKDSISNIGLVQQMARLRTDFEISQKQSEVDLLEKEAEIRALQDKRQKAGLYISIGGLLGTFLLVYGLYRRNRYIQATSSIIEKEKNRSNALLRNILPEETAEELKEFGRVQAKKFDSVSVMFADFQGFTTYSEKMNPEDLVRNVDFYFSRFDQIVETHQLEKIKTMGDCYMCAGGLPFPSGDHALRMVRAAEDIRDFVAETKRNPPSGISGFDVRIGINTGPVVAGVVGTKKFAYDVWGDTVNIASRMESNSVPGRINVSENTYALIRDQVACEFRGMIRAKNKGMMKMYFVSERDGTDS